MSTYPSGSIGAMFPEAAALMEALLAERNALEAELVVVRQENEQLLAEVGRLRGQLDDTPFAVSVGTGMKPSAAPMLAISDETQARIDEQINVLNRGAVEARTAYLRGPNA